MALSVHIALSHTHTLVCTSVMSLGYQQMSQTQIKSMILTKAKYYNKPFQANFVRYTDRTINIHINIQHKHKNIYGVASNLWKMSYCQPFNHKCCFQGNPWGLTCEGRCSLTHWEQRDVGLSLAAEQSKPVSDRSVSKMCAWSHQLLVDLMVSITVLLNTNYYCLHILILWEFLSMWIYFSLYTRN